MADINLRLLSTHVLCDRDACQTAFFVSQTYTAVALDNKSVYVLNSEGIQRTFTEPTELIWTVAISEDDIFMGKEDGSISVYDIQSGFASLPLLYYGSTSNLSLLTHLVALLSPFLLGTQPGFPL